MRTIEERIPAKVIGFLLTADSEKQVGGNKGGSGNSISKAGDGSDISVIVHSCKFRSDRLIAEDKRENRFLMETFEKETGLVILPLSAIYTLENKDDPAQLVYEDSGNRVIRVLDRKREWPLLFMKMASSAIGEKMKTLVKGIV
jgi:hypothetical protein